MSERPNMMGAIEVTAPPMGTVIGDEGDPMPLIADEGSVLVLAMPNSTEASGTTMLLGLEDSKELIKALARARRQAKRQMRK